jgi:hypothetical protein
MSSSPSKDAVETKAPRILKRRRSRWLFAVLVFACAVPAFFLMVLHTSHSKLDYETVHVRSELDSLSSRLASLESQDKQITSQLSSSRELLRFAYSTWRSVDEIPEVASELMISRTHGFGYDSKTFITVPTGRHQLLLKFAVSDTTADENNGIEVESLDRNYDLVGSASYCFEFQKTSNDLQSARQLKVAITSNAPDFDPIYEDVLAPIERLNSISSRASDSQIQFSNQVDEFVRFAAANPAPRAVIREETWRTKRREQRLKVEFTLKIQSDGPLVLPAQRINPFTFELGYLGKGKYEYLPKPRQK